MSPASATNASPQPSTHQKPTAPDIACALASELALRANAATDEDRLVTGNFALLKASGLLAAGVPAELGGGDANVDELAEMPKNPRSSLWVDRAGVLHAHPSGRDSRLALEVSEDRSGAIAAQARGARAHRLGHKWRVRNMQ